MPVNGGSGTGSPSGDRAVPDEYRNGVALYKAGKLDEALACLERVVQSQPDNCAVLRLVGAIHAQRREHSKAIRSLRRVLVLNPDSAPDLYNLGVAHQAAGDIGSARHCYENALAADPTYQNARQALEAVLAGTHAASSAAAAAQPSAPMESARGATPPTPHDGSVTTQATEAILTAARTGDRRAAERLLQENPALANARMPGENAIAPLSLAARNGHTDLAELLIAAGADVNAKHGDGGTALHSAPWSKHKPVVELLIVKGADVNAKAKNGTTPLHVAATEDTAIAELLVRHGADVNARDCNARTPLYQAAAIRDKTRTVELLIAAGADVNAEERLYGFVPLHIAAANGNIDTIELLIRSGADINPRSRQDETPLAIAVDKGQEDAAYVLRQHGGTLEPEPPPGEPWKLLSLRPDQD